MRAGIQSIPRGQVFAGQALGMTYGQNMRLVVLPQAFRNMLPVLLTQTIILFQDTSLVYAIGAYDLLKGFETAGKNYGRPIETYLVAAVTYFVICYSLSSRVADPQEDRHHPIAWPTPVFTRCASRFASSRAEAAVRASPAQARRRGGTLAPPRPARLACGRAQPFHGARWPAHPRPLFLQTRQAAHNNLNRFARQGTHHVLLHDSDQERFQVVRPGAGAARLLAEVARATWWLSAAPRARASPR
jgi:hypothetical protein